MIGAYHRCVADTVERFGGFVARYMGDGALVYFGYPQALRRQRRARGACGACARLEHRRDSTCLRSVCMYASVSRRVWWSSASL